MTKLLLVRWMDATMEGGWVDIADAKADVTGAEAMSIGFMVDENEDWLKIAQTITEGSVGNQVTIPKPWILSRNTIDLDDEA